MKKFYSCTITIRNPYTKEYAYLRKISTAEKAEPYLIYNIPFSLKTQRIPIILVEENDTILEFFTKTRFERKGNYAWSGLGLPQSTLIYYGRSSNSAHYRELLPTEALKILEPCMKNYEKYANAINKYFDCFRDEFKRKQEEELQAKRKELNAEEILSNLWRKH